jgi:SET domain-containing protein
MTKFINHSDTPNIEWVEEVVGGAVRILLRVIEGRRICPGDELTVNYGRQYWKNKEKYV